MKSPWQHKVTLIRNGQEFTVNNPTPYYVIISNASAHKNGNPPAGFTPLIMEPQSSAPLNVKMDTVPVLTYINDYGARICRCTLNALAIIARWMKSKAAKADAGRVL